MPLSARCVGANQHLDAAVALPARLSGFIAFGPRLTERAGEDPTIRHSSGNERITNVIDATLTQTLIVTVGSARNDVAMDAHPGARILLQLGRDVSYMARLGRANRRLIEIEPVLYRRVPAGPAGPCAPIGPAGPMGPAL